jgi:hypothetical protein
VASTADKRGPNFIEIAGRHLVLVSTGGGSATHRAPAVAEEHAGRGAVADFYFGEGGHHDGARRERHDQAALTEPRWAPRMLCGRDWAVIS